MVYFYKKNIDALPDHMHEGMINYIEDGVPPGSFLAAVLENNLTMAVMKADHINRHRIVDFVEYLMWFSPNGCYGNEEAVQNWIKTGGLRGLGYELE